jgi:uncharacterized membrane protein
MAQGTEVRDRYRDDAADTRAAERLARALGWFSLGLGAVQIAAPRRLARLIGMEDSRENRAVMRGVGVRETASGVGLLTRPRPAGFLWARVVGDAMDLALLGNAFRHRDDGSRRRVAAAMTAVAVVAVPDLVGSARLSGRSGSEAKASTTEVKTATTVRRPPEEVYAFWHDFENLPRFMEHLEKVAVTGRGTSRWTAKAPGGRTVEWDAEIVDEETGRLISWRSLARAGVHNSGKVTFQPAPGERGTEVRLELRYDMPGGALGDIVAKLFGEEPEQQVRDDLRRFKHVVETGEVVRSDGTPKGTATRRLFKQREAQPISGSRADPTPDQSPSGTNSA